MTRVKICGITTREHARAALDAGADFLGFVFYGLSSRYVEPEVAGEIVRSCRATFGGPERWQAVGVFVDESLESANRTLSEADLDLAQLCGAEDLAYIASIQRPVVRVLHVSADAPPPSGVTAADYGAARLLLDSKVAGRFGGTGLTYAWEGVREVAGEAFVAGGLNPGNVGSAIAAAAPWAVDVSSGVERGGSKSGDLIREFVLEVRRVDGDRI